MKTTPPECDNSKGKTILSSKKHPLKKIIYGNWSFSYYCVSFIDYRDDALVICASSQIWCVEACQFCATWSKRFVKNLDKAQILEEFLDWSQTFSQLHNKDIDKLYIIMEGMWEASYNLDNVFSALLDFLAQIHKKYKTIVFSVSTIWNINLINLYIDFIEKNKKPFSNVTYQFQISLHTPFDKERCILIPVTGKKYDISKIINTFYTLSDYLNIKLKCNYLLLNYPWWWNNYSIEHLTQLIKILDSHKSKIKLTKYSDTWKGFSSPDENTYVQVKKYLESFWLQTHVRDILWDDIESACGMLDY